MAILDDARKALRMSNIALDSEITDLIDGARQDLILSGILSTKTNDDTDPLIKRAIIIYTKANFGFDNPDAERLQKSYDSLKMSLALSTDYTGDADIIGGDVVIAGDEING